MTTTMGESCDTRQLALAVRRHAVNMTNLGKSSHIGSVLSIADLLAVLYGKVMNVRPHEPKWPQRDRFILSKGHAGAGVYAVLAECGFMSVDILKTHYQNGSKLSGHVSHKGIPGVEFSTGSLGHGLSVACGMALAAKLNENSYQVYTLLSDGECNEGSNWEAILFAPHHKLDNLTVLVDHNKLQSLKSTDETLSLAPFADKWAAFGWDVQEIDGHDHQTIERALTAPSVLGKPRVIIAHTVKGKGVSFMEHSVLWHYRNPQGAEYDAAMAELAVAG